jgi:hypothetical protein
MTTRSFGIGTPESLTDLYATDTLLDALSVSVRGPATQQPQEPVLRLLQALAFSVDADLDDDVDPVAVAALAAGFELAASDDPAEVAHELTEPRRQRGTNRLHVVGGTAGRQLRRPRRPYRLVAVAAGVVLAFGGGGFAAAETTDPAHAWGPLKPVVLALHPGWQGDVFAAKRAAIMRTLDRASEQSLAGEPVAAAVSYGTAKQQARELPKAADADLRARFDAVARQLGLLAETPSPNAPAPPTSIPTPTGSSEPISGAAPGTLPPVPPPSTGTSPGSTTGAGATTTGSTPGSTGAPTGAPTNAPTAGDEASGSPSPSPGPDPSSGAPTAGTESGATGDAPPDDTGDTSGSGVSSTGSGVTSTDAGSAAGSDAGATDSAPVKAGTSTAGASTAGGDTAATTASSDSSDSSASAGSGAADTSAESVAGSAGAEDDVTAVTGSA